MHNGVEVITEKTLRFKAKSFKGEYHEFDFTNSRQWEDVNLLIVMSEHKSRTIDIFQDAMAEYIRSVMVLFNNYAIATSSALTLYFVVFSIVLIKF